MFWVVQLFAVDHRRLLGARRPVDRSLLGVGARLFDIDKCT